MRESFFQAYLPFVFLSPMNPFQLPPQDPGQVGRLVAHGILVNGHEFLERGKGHGFREILDHSQDSLVQGAVDLASVLNVLEFNKQCETNKRGGEKDTKNPMETQREKKETKCRPRETTQNERDGEFGEKKTREREVKHECGGCSKIRNKTDTRARGCRATHYGAKVNK